MGNGEVKVPAPKKAEEKAEYTIEVKSVDKKDLTSAGLPNVQLIVFEEKAQQEPMEDVTFGSPLEQEQAPGMEFKLANFAYMDKMLLIRYEGELPRKKNGTINEKKVMKEVEKGNIEIVEAVDFQKAAAKNAYYEYKKAMAPVNVDIKKEELAAKAPEKKPHFSEGSMQLERGEFSMDIKDPETGDIVTVSGSYEKSFGGKLLLTMKTDNPAHADLFAKTIGQVAPAHDITKIAKLPMDTSAPKKQKAIQ